MRERPEGAAERRKCVQPRIVWRVQRRKSQQGVSHSSPARRWRLRANPAVVTLMPMKSSRPYLVRALYEWILESACTPYVLVDATAPGVEVPTQFVKDGQIVLNLSPSAVTQLVIGNDELRFRGRFGGVATDVVAPIRAVLGIYARENGQGMVFEAERPEPPPDGGGDPPVARPSLRVVK